MQFQSIFPGGILRLIRVWQQCLSNYLIPMSVKGLKPENEVQNVTACLLLVLRCSRVQLWYSGINRIT